MSSTNRFPARLINQVLGAEGEIQSQSGFQLAFLGKDAREDFYLSPLSSSPVENGSDLLEWADVLEEFRLLHDVERQYLAGSSQVDLAPLRRYVDIYRDVLLRLLVEVSVSRQEVRSALSRTKRIQKKEGKLHG